MSNPKAVNLLDCDFLIFTDGACSGNPGPGGWGTVIATRDGQIQELGGGVENTTNNRMELSAAIRGLRFIEKKSGRVNFFTDSTYVIRGITQWIWGWRRKGWKNAEGEEVQNRDLWEDLSALVQARKPNEVNWYYSRGHVGTPGNERCDEIAVAFSQGRHISLYRGSLLQYSVAIHDLPADTTLPEMRPKEEKKPAYSYLSCLHGVVIRHKDWASCERRVKGQSGAKFKKAMSSQDEPEILAAWGLSRNTPISD